MCASACSEPPPLFLAPPTPVQYQHTSTHQCTRANITGGVPPGPARGLRALPRYGCFLLHSPLLCLPQRHNHPFSGTYTHTLVQPLSLTHTHTHKPGILHEGRIDKRVQYSIEGLFAVRKSGFADFPAVPEALDLVEKVCTCVYFSSHHSSIPGLTPTVARPRAHTHTYTKHNHRRTASLSLQHHTSPTPPLFPFLPTQTPAATHPSAKPLIT